MSELKSLANTEAFPAGVGVAVNREMMVWDKDNSIHKKFVCAWDGQWFAGTWGSAYNACEIPKKRMRQMTHKECFQLAEQGAVFHHVTSTNYYAGWNTTKGIQYHEYCLPKDLTDDIVSSPWKPLETECE